jgi:DNA adenine methylase
MPDSTRSSTEASPPKLDPFLRWAGGKRRLVPHLLHALPPDIRERKYHEAFVGAGSLFLAVQPKKAVLSDANGHLIACYEWIRKSPDLVASYLQQHLSRNEEQYYYEVRDLYNRSASSAAQAARFVYLNKACFNGIFRVNLKGDFNVPYGHKEPPLIPTRSELRAISELLKGSTLHARPFEIAIEAVEKDDFVYLDPPYPPLNGTSYFTHYTAERFGEVDQRMLATAVKDLDRRGAKFMMSNADTEMIREIYSDHNFQFLEVSVTRYVTCKAKKHRAPELIITNYPVPGYPK